MKQDKNKYIRILAKKIAKLEQEISLGNSVQENKNKIEEITSSLSYDDMIAIDDYIHRKNLLTK